MGRTSSKSTFIILLLGLIPAFTGCKQGSRQGEDHPYTNALVHETSPYLLQHAHNPVDWMPWGEEALETAQKEEKLIVLSIGYSSCHWCHVMEEESFEDTEVARLMNSKFISIKVDREERPDIDQVYMTAVQLMTGNGGWPLNLILLPNGKPLYGGTYHTKKQWMEVLSEVNRKYQEDKGAAEKYASRVTQGVAEVNFIPKPEAASELKPELLKSGIDVWKAQWDMKWGGDLGEQKFILPGNLKFLLEYASLTKDLETDVFVKNTLEQIIRGGIYDHVGGGFFRYSTDPNWKVPHFEKMLYDNAQIISLYSKAYTLYKEPEYKRVVMETIAFLNREMKDVKGGYYAAIDADSEGEEGAYYVWGKEELQSVLGNDFELFSRYYSIKPSSAWEKDKYVLFKKETDAEFANSEGIGVAQIRVNEDKWNKALLTARKKRIAPRKDDKIITSWNSLLISGLVDAYKAFGDKQLLETALEVMNSLKETSYSEQKLVHSYKEGSSREEGFLEDYTFLAKASLSLYEVTLDTEYLQFADTLMKEVQSRFYDETSGMYRYNEASELISKIVKIDDGVIPSPNAVAAENILLLGQLYYNTLYLDRAGQMLQTMVPRVRQAMNNHSLWSHLVLKRVYPFYEIVTVGGEAELLVQDLNRLFLPNALVVGSTSSSELPLFEDRFVEGETFIYVCVNNTCKLPVKSVTEALQQLQDFQRN